MNRDELLTNLAMELEEWPDNVNRVALDRLYKDFNITRKSGDTMYSSDLGKIVTKNEWLAERERLINKPSWDEAPKEAQWMAQDADGEWGFHHDLPVARNVVWACGRYGSFETAQGSIPAGHDWRTTLEARPQEQSAESRLNDNTLARDAETVTAASILRSGLSHMEDRAATYDKPDGERSMAATVSAFAAITGIQMTEEQGWLFMGVLKDARSQQGDYRADNYEDRAAYAGLQGEAAYKSRAK